MYRKPQLGPPWGGWIDGLPSIAAKATSFKQITNWLIQKGRLQSAFAFNQGSQLLGTDPVLKLRSFQDATGGWHTILLTNKTIQSLFPDGTWNIIPQPGGLSPLLPFTPPAFEPWSTEIFQNALYFSAGPQKLMSYIGDNNLQVAGDVPGGCFFLGKLASRLIMLNTFENQVQNPRRVRWCGINNPNEWNFTIDPSAGSLDVPEVEDQISGFSVGYNVGYIYRSHGISSMTPTGNPSVPFLIQNYESGPKGVGAFYTYSLASWGSTSVFGAENDIYSFDGGQLNGIGASAKKSILADLASSVNQISATMIGQIVPGIDYLTYWLLCPQTGGNTNIWIYHYDDQSWVKVQAPTLDAGKYISCVDTIYTS